MQPSRRTASCGNPPSAITNLESEIGGWAGCRKRVSGLSPANIKTQDVTPCRQNYGQIPSGLVEQQDLVDRGLAAGRDSEEVGAGRQSFGWELQGLATRLELKLWE